MPNDVPPRITEDDREATVRRLQEAFAEGHISHAEMDDHLRAVLTAEIYKTPPRLDVADRGSGSPARWSTGD